MQRILRCAAAALLVGCAGRPVDVGSNLDGITDDGGGGSNPAGTMGDAGLGGWPSADACRSGDQLSIVGTWQGYMEMANLPSRSDAVKLVISSANASSVCGTITFGTGTPPQVPTDPNDGDIPGIADGGPTPNYGSLLIDGSPLTILNGRPSLPRLQFEANPNQFWKPWCELQTPYLREGTTDEWHCLPLDAQGTWTYTPATGCLLGDLMGGVPVNCAKAALCAGNPICSCTATGCTVWAGDGGFQFDLRVMGDEIQGRGISGNMYLTRVH